MKTTMIYLLTTILLLLVILTAIFILFVCAGALLTMVMTALWKAVRWFLEEYTNWSSQW